MFPSIASIFQIPKYAESIACFLGLSEATERKIERLCGAPYNSACRSLQNSLTSQTQRKHLLREAQREFTTALGLERKSSLALAYVGLSMCQYHLGDTANAIHTLRELCSQDFTDYGRRDVRKKIKKVAPILSNIASLAALFSIPFLPWEFALAGAVSALAGAVSFQVLRFYFEQTSSFDKVVGNIVPLTDEQTSFALQDAAKAYIRSHQT